MLLNGQQTYFIRLNEHAWLALKEQETQRNLNLGVHCSNLLPLTIDSLFP